jgi:hypothetical protein
LCQHYPHDNINKIYPFEAPMKDTARGLASFGRGGDTELIHMTKGEIRGLQDLALAHGGSLTINPHTGLPEAGFLRSLLPMVIGGALTAFSGGALSPLAAAMITGAGYGAVTGDLKKGLMAGMGAYGGAGLGTGLAEMGAATAPTTIGEAALPVTTPLPSADPISGAITTPSTPLPSADPISGAITTPLPRAIPTTETSLLDADGLARASDVAKYGYGTELPALPTDSLSYDQLVAAEKMAGKGSFGDPQQYNVGLKTFVKTTPNAPILGSQKLGDMASGFGQLDSMKGLSTLGNKVGMGTIGAALTPTIMDTMYPERKGVGMGAYQPDQYDQRLARYHLAENYQPYVPAQPDPYYRAQYAKGGGVSKYEGRDPRSASIPDVGIIKLDDISTANKDPYEAALIRLKEAASRANLSYAAPTIASTPASPALKGLGDIGKPTAMMAAGGSLGGYSDGGHLLRGPGDGMSDNIPATINRKQPARLADGEFVVPADVVSHLGNGSTDAGAKKLYAMLNKVRQARTGRKAQGRQINSNKFMPV